jgi:hypothetical protein
MTQQMDPFHELVLVPKERATCTTKIFQRAGDRDALLATLAITNVGQQATAMLIQIGDSRH